MTILEQRMQTLLQQKPKDADLERLSGLKIKKKHKDRAMVVALSLLEKAEGKDVTAIKEVKGLCEGAERQEKDPSLTVKIIDV